MIHKLAFLMALLVGCGSSTEPQTTAPAPLAVSDEGQRLDPPVDVAKIPNGAWMCDMGTVHYAAGDKHDGKCPVCGMDLTQKKSDDP